MSVQVKRRREAAMFLAGYVGAQGELLVDTTNNRVQVHDGATAGGWAAASVGDVPGRNAVINGTFAINQRVYSSGTALAANAYGHDRWKAGPGGCTYTFAQTVPDTLVTITAGTLVQAVDAPNVYATSYWLTWIGTATARVWQGAAAGAYSAGTTTKTGGVTVNALLVTGLGLGVITTLEFSTGTLGLVQFEAALPNAGPTRFERRHGEIALCLRYAYVFNDISNTGGVGQTSQSVFCRFTFPIQMRAVPSISVLSSGSFTVSDDYASNYMVNNPTIIYATAGTNATRFAVNNFPSGTFVQGRFYASAVNGTALFLASAEI